MFDKNLALNKALSPLLDARRSRLDRGVGANGQPLESLSPKTVERKGTTSILIETGDLREGLVMKLEGDEIIMTVEDSNYSKRLYYAINGTGTQPPRPFANIDNQDLEIVLNSYRSVSEWFH